MKKIMISTGGAGTEIMQYNFDFDYVSHERGMKMPSKFLYLFAHPYNILLSFDRRNFISNDMGIRQLQGDEGSAKLNDITNLNSYLSTGIDCFKFGEHFNNYYSQNSIGLFVKFEGLAKNIEKVIAFLDLKRENDREIRERISNYKNLDNSMLNKMNNIHGKYADFFEKLPMIFTNEKKEFSYNYKYDN